MSKQRFSIEHLLDLRRVAFGVPFHLSPDGRWLSVSILQSNRRREVVAQERFFSNNGVPVDLIGSRAVLLDTKTGNTEEPFAKASESWGGQWSPDGKRLAALVQNGGNVMLGIWETESGNTRLFPQARTHTLMGYEVPLWTSDSSKVILKLCPLAAESDNPAEDELSVVVQSFDPAFAESTDGLARRSPLDRERYLGYCDRHRGDVGVVEVDTGAIEHIATEWVWTIAKVAPDGHAVAIFRGVDDVAELFVDLMVVPLDGAAPYAVAERIPKPWNPLGLAWSPDGRSIAYSSGRMSHHLFVADSNRLGVAKELTAKGGSGTGFCGTLQWSPNGRHIYSAGGGNIWEFAADGSSARQIAANSTHGVTFCCQPRSSSAVCAEDGNSLLAVARDKVTWQDILGQIDLTTGEVNVLFEFGESKVDGPLNTEVAPKGSACYFLTKGLNHLDEIQMAGANLEGHTLCPMYVLNPTFGEIEFGKMQLIHYRDSEGQSRTAAVILPPGYTEGTPVPMIVFAYAGADHSRWVRRFDERGQVLAASGYAILYPDMPVDRRDRLRSLPGLVWPAVNKAVELGIADPARIGLHGESYGSWSVIGLLCQTSIFGAAVVVAPMGINMTSMFSIFPEWCEHGEAHMGGSPWEQRDSYIENSPFFYLDRVRAPLLVAYGSESIHAGAQPQELLVGLSRLKQRVELRKYMGEGHSPNKWAESNLKDFYLSVVGWYNAHLQPAQNG